MLWCSHLLLKFLCLYMSLCASETSLYPFVISQLPHGSYCEKLRAAVIGANDVKGVTADRQSDFNISVLHFLCCSCGYLWLNTELEP